MAKMRKFNTKSAKLNTPQVQELYARLCEGETQGSLAREYGLSVIQVGRIARGESRAQETGANGAPVPNHNFQATQGEVDASAARVLALLDKPPTAGKATSLYEDPPPEDPAERFMDRSALQRLTGDIQAKVEKSPEGQLDRLEKGDSK
jgi:hypothetical protein